jgi:hypothetical protein
MVYLTTLILAKPVASNVEIGNEFLVLKCMEGSGSDLL